MSAQHRGVFEAARAPRPPDRVRTRDQRRGASAASTPRRSRTFATGFRRPSAAVPRSGFLSFGQFSVQESNLSAGLRRPSSASVGRRVDILDFRFEIR